MDDQARKVKGDDGAALALKKIACEKQNIYNVVVPQCFVYSGCWVGDFHARAGFGLIVDDATSVGETRDQLIDFLFILISCSMFMIYCNFHIIVCQPL